METGESRPAGSAALNIVIVALVFALGMLFAFGRTADPESAQAPVSDQGSCNGNEGDASGCSPAALSVGGAADQGGSLTYPVDGSVVIDLPVSSEPVAPAERLSLETIKSSTAGRIRAVDGTLRAGSIVMYGLTEYIIRDELVAFGDLDLDGDEDAVVVLTPLQTENAAETPIMNPVMNKNGAAEWSVTYAIGWDRRRLGDGMVPTGISIADGGIVSIDVRYSGRGSTTLKYNWNAGMLLPHTPDQPLEMQLGSMTASICGQTVTFENRPYVMNVDLAPAILYHLHSQFDSAICRDIKESGRTTFLFSAETPRPGGEAFSIFMGDLELIIDTKLMTVFYKSADGVTPIGWLLANRAKY